MPKQTPLVPTPRFTGLLTQYRVWFVVLALAGLTLRLLFVVRFRLLPVDALVYGDIAKNWLLHHTYGLSEPGTVVPTYIRLPGYPAFLAAVFAIFGMEHYTAVMMLQVAMDLGTCLLIAHLALRAVGPRAARWAFLLAALNPFLANYTATVLTETLAVFFTALALDLALSAELSGRLHLWAACGLALGGGLLLRPDGGILLAVLGGYLLLRCLQASPQPRRQRWTALVLLSVCALAPLVPWTLRNWRTLHVFQPLTPLYANAPDEYVPRGFHRWVKTWVADYSSNEDIWFKVAGEAISANDLPSRAFDSEDERRRTEQVIADYNQALTLSPELDTQFAELARDRVRRHPVRYYVWLPALRIADLWLRPRTELLPLDPHWWQYEDDPHDSSISMSLGLVNLLFVAAALLGLRRYRQVRFFWVMSAFVIGRSLFLATMPNPEPRYVLECFPVMLLLAAVGLTGWRAHEGAATPMAEAIGT